MQTRKLGNSDMHITPVGFGAWAAGGPWKYGWSKQDDNDSIAAIHKALDLGINWIDTAPIYGLGHSEEVVARALEGISQRPYVFTKCSQIWNEQHELSESLKADSLRQEAEASLRRLKVDVIDLYQIHWPRMVNDIEEGWTTLAELQKAGKVRWIAVSNFNVEQMQRCLNIAPITSLQPPYSPVQRAVDEEILPFAEKHNIGVIVYSPMQAGLLSGTMTKDRVQNLPADDWRLNNAQFQEPRLSRNLKLAEKLKEIGARHGCSAGVVSIAWTLRLSAVTGAIVGARNSGQVGGFIEAAEFRLSQAEIEEIAAFTAEIEA
jgi:aryl-alcohol dehydrogenase-like predicted oxidoreductase